MSAEAADGGAPRPEGAWAKPVDRLHVTDDHKDVAFNLEGRRVAGPQQGFGSLWDRSFTVALGSAIGPEALIRNWRAHFGEYWPEGGTFYGSMTSIEAGDVAPLSAGGGAVKTGVLVIYADDSSFSYMTPYGHMLCAMITFSARAEGEQGTVAEIRMLVRPADPSWQLFWPVVKRMEGRFWRQTLTNLAAAHGVTGAPVAETTTKVDGRWIWKNWTNVFTNGFIATLWHGMTHRRRGKARAA